MLANKAEATGRVAELNSEGIIEIRFPYSRELVENVKRVPGRNWHSEEKMWDAPPSKDAIKFLEWHGFLLGVRLKEWIADRTPGPVVSELNIPGLRCTLRPYQAEGVQRIEAFKGRAILADSMGLGKTAQAIAWLQLHKTERPAVILCPSVGKEMWARKCEEWMDGKEKIVVLSGKTPDPTQFKGASILILNYDIVGNKTDKTKNKAGYVKIQEQSYTGWVDYLLDHGIKMVVADECFVAGTMISTPNGDIPIENLRQGDVVYNATGTGVVERTSVNQKKTITMRLSNKETITCTPDHPIFTERGWLPAIACQEKKLFTYSDIFNIMSQDIILKRRNINEEENMRMVWKRVRNRILEGQSFLRKILCSNLVNEQAGNKGQVPCRTAQNIQKTNRKGVRSVRSDIHTQGKDFNTALLREILLSEMEDVCAGDKGENVFREKPRSNKKRVEAIPRKEPACGQNLAFKAHERKQSDEKPGHCQKSERPLQKIWPPITKTTIERRQWEAAAKTAENPCGCTRLRMESGTRHPNKRKIWQWFPQLLQSRFSVAFKKGLDRAGWLEPLFTWTTGKRREKNSPSGQIRVERVEDSEQRCGNKTEENTVYNLQVSGHPSFFANGILVHNCHALKSDKSQRGIAGLKMLKQIRYALPMSGTPIDNRPYEYWPILTNLASHIFRNRYTYGKRYCGGTKTRFGWDFSGASNLAELHEVLEENIMIRRRKEDVLKELPPKVRAVVPIDVDLKAYRKAEAEIWDDDEITLAKLTKLRQAAVAAKLKACGDWVEDFLETGEKLIVFAHHHFVMDHLRERFAGKYKIAEISGQTKGSRQEQEDLFQNDPNCKLFLGSKSAKELITLTAASNVAFVEFFDTPGEMAQAEDRAHRIGQTGSVNVWFLIAAGTIEEDHAALLDAKLQVVTNVLDGKDVGTDDLIMELLNKIKARRKK